MTVRSNKGQSMVEYLLIVAVVIAAVAVSVGTLISPAVNQTITESGNSINNAAAQLGAKLQ
jgi:Flp pilus assembly pilin Flp